MKSQAEKKYNLFLALIIITIIVSVGLIGSGWYYVLSISKNAGKTFAEKENVKKESDALADLMIRYRKVQSTKPLLMQAVPESKDTSSFISSVEDVAKRNHLVINSSLVNSQSKSKPNDLSQTISKQGFNELKIKYIVMGSYADFANFLKQMDEIRRINIINDMNINYDIANSKDKADAIRASFSITIYVKK